MIYSRNVFSIKRLAVHCIQTTNCLRTTSLCSASYVSCKRGTTRIAAERRAAAPCCCGARPCSNRSISPTRRAHSSKPAASYCSGRMARTDGRTPHRCVYPAPYTMRTLPVIGIKPYCVAATAARRFATTGLIHSVYKSKTRDVRTSNMK